MPILTLTTQGTKLAKQKKRFAVKKDEETIAEIPVRKVESIIAFGNINFTNSAISLAARNGVPLTLLTYNGFARGQFLPPVRKNMDLKYAQYKTVESSDRALEFAKAFVYGKLKSAEIFSVITRRQRKPDYNIKNLKRSFLRIKTKIGKSKNLDELLGYEAAVSVAHFSELRNLIKNRQFNFPRRSAHPPRDPFNAMMSFGYVLTENIITSVLATNGFDVYMGFLHRPDYGRASLSLDILELFRFHVIDKFVLTLVNKKIVTPRDFVNENGVFLAGDGRSKFLKNWTDLLHDNNKGLIKQITAAAEILAKAVRTGEIPDFETIISK